jgi:sodium/bile acid cotransporter 7
MRFANKLALGRSWGDDARMIQWMRAAGAALRPMLPFFAGLGLTLGLAVAAPEVGAPGGVLGMERAVPVAVALIFFIQGLQLPVDQVRHGLGAWQVHVFCQGWMFGVFPMMGLAVVGVMGGAMSAAERIGVMYLCVLPTTIATNAAFSARAGGNVAVALVNIVLGNALGVLLAPAALAWMLARGVGTGVEAGPLARALGLQLVLPFLLGQVARVGLAEWAQQHKAWLREAGSVLIFVIIYAAVCQYLAGPAGWTPPGAGVAVGVALLLLGGKALCWAALSATGWPREWRVAAFYAASQKTLAAGLPMAGAVLAALDPAAAPVPLAALALPLILFHLGQLVVGALLIPVLGQEGR